MLDLLGLESRVVSFSSAGAGGDEYATMKPTDGEIWIVAEANGYNDEGALSSRWSLLIGGTETTLDPAITVAGAASRISCYGKSPESANAYHGPALPFVLDSNTQLRWTTFGLAAGKKSYIDGVVLVVRGIPVQ